MNIDTQDAEDTAFYAQLTSQILLLMDDDDVTHTRTRKGAPELGRRPVSGGSASISGWLEGGRSLVVPGWMESLWANNGAGTGVFIPRVAAASKPRRKRHHRSRKNKNRDSIDSSAEQKVHG
ncbi:hypothetical protein HanIR_Chr16g0840951 [Helianthus annuus]|nr:hypothetical protein HanIR_Chr16g0840951 [Helianthus annuus]